jgi:hypothetical protein
MTPDLLENVHAYIEHMRRRLPPAPPVRRAGPGGTLIWEAPAPLSAGYILLHYPMPLDWASPHSGR